MHNYRYVLPRSGTGYLKSDGVSPFQPDNVYCVTSTQVLSPELIKRVHQDLEKMHSIRLVFDGVIDGKYLFKETL